MKWARLAFHHRTELTEQTGCQASRLVGILRWSQAVCGLSVSEVSLPSPPHISRELNPVDEILGPLTEILEGVLQADRQLMEKTKAKVFSAFITVLQMKEMRGERQSGV